MLRALLVTLVTTVILFPGVSHAQVRDRMGNPAIPVNLTHPPSLGIQAKRIAFGDSSGPCSDQLIDMVKEEFIKHQVEVIDRQNLNAMLREHNFSMSGYVDQASAAQLGKILGPSALVFAKVQRCAPEKKALYETRSVYRDGQRFNIRVNISRTQFFFRGSIQTVDLATGRIFSAKTLEFSPSRQNEAENAVAEYPSDFEMQDVALQLATTTVSRMFFPWDEQRKLIFFDDKDCNLKPAYQMVKSNTLGEAVRLSEENVSNCKKLAKVEDKTLGHAYYNLGMSYYMTGQYETALSNLHEAARLRPGDIVAEAIELVNEASANAVDMQKTETRMAVETAESAKRVEADAAARQPKVLAVKDVLGMREAGLSDDLIEAQIRKNNRAFDLSTDDMLNLKRNGFSDGTIKLLLDPSAPTPAPAVAAPPSPRAAAPNSAPKQTPARKP